MQAQLVILSFYPTFNTCSLFNFHTLVRRAGFDSYNPNMIHKTVSYQNRYTRNAITTSDPFFLSK